MITNFQKRVIAILQESPNGLTSNEIAERFATLAFRHAIRQGGILLAQMKGTGKGTKREKGRGALI